MLKPTKIKCFDIALLAGEISQLKTQSNGWDNLTDFWMDNFSGEFFDIENLEWRVDIMIESTDEIVSRHKAWTPLQQTRAAIVVWEYGLNYVYR